MTLDQLYTSAFTLTEKEQAALSKLMVAEYKTAYISMTTQLKSLYANLSGIDPKDYYSYMAKYGRMASLTINIRSAYLEAAKKAGALQYISARLSLTNTFARQDFALKWITEAQQFTMVPDAYVQASVFGSLAAWNIIAAPKKAALILKYGSIDNYLPKSGFLIDTVLSRHRVDDLQKLQGALTQGLIRGKTYREMARDIRGILNTAANNAIRIAATEGHRNMMAGNYAAMHASRDQVPGARRMIASTLDDGTRAQSASMDGQFEDDNGFFTYPNGIKVVIPGNSGVAGYDINDRESVVLTFNGERPQMRRARAPSIKDPKTGKMIRGETDIISWKPYSEWAKSVGLKKSKYGQYYRAEDKLNAAIKRKALKDKTFEG